MDVIACVFVPFIGVPTVTLGAVAGCAQALLHSQGYSQLPMFACVGITTGMFTATALYGVTILLAPTPRIVGTRKRRDGLDSLGRIIVYSALACFAVPYLGIVGTAWLKHRG